MDLRYQELNCSEPVLLVHDSCESDPGRKSKWCCHSIPDRDDLRVTKLERRKETPTIRKAAAQPVPISMFFGAHPFIGLSDKRVSKAIGNHVSVCGTGVPVAQHIFFRMNKVNITLAGGCDFHQCTHYTLRHCNCTQSRRDRAIRKQKAQGYHDSGSSVTAGTKAFYMKLGRSIKRDISTASSCRLAV